MSTNRPPRRLVHLGLGNFFRAHQAALTAAAPDGDDWRYTAFAGRGAGIAGALAASGGRYHLLQRGADGDLVDEIRTITAAHPGDDRAALDSAIASPDTAAVTLTITEAGYRAGADGRLDRADPDVAADLDALRAGATTSLRTAPGRLVGGLVARARADAGPITLVPCDNVAGNASVLAGIVAEFADAAGIGAWIETSVTTVGTVVDRITPATTDADRATVLDLTGVDDPVPVVTEPFVEWVLDAVPAAGPDWAGAGAVVAPDLVPYERRKLWLLNGAHTTLAVLGLAAGHATVDAAIADDAIAAVVDDWWSTARRPLLDAGAAPEDLDRYQRALRTRFANPRLPHRLDQIATDTAVKLPLRLLPVLRTERAAGRLPTSVVTVLAAWTDLVETSLAAGTLRDARAQDLATAAEAPERDRVRALVHVLDPTAALTEDPDLVAAISETRGLASAS